MTKLSLLLLAAIPSCVAQLVATKWEMDDPTFTLGEADGNDKAFTFVYGGISDLITIADAANAFYDFDCATEVDSTLGAFTVDPTTGFTLDAATADSNDGSLTLVFEAVPQTITASTDLYTAGTAGGEIKFCVRTSLNLISGDTTTEINFLETQVTIAISLDGSFTTDSVLVAPKDKTTTTSDQTYEVEAKMCDPTDEGATFNQGMVISVCVRPKGEAVTDGIIMASVDSFTWERGAGDDLIQQPAVKMGDTGMEAHDALSSYTLADGSTHITISSVLFASFYATTGTVAATGSATMQFPAARRRLGDDNSNNRRRRIQEEGAIPPSPFDVRADVVAATDGPAQILQTAGGASTTVSMIGAIVVGLVSAVLFA